MANDLNTNPVYLDTYGADVICAQGPAWVTMITVTENGGVSAKKVVFIDNSGTVVAIIQVGISATEFWVPASPHQFANGLIFDESASSLANSDEVLVYLK